MSAGNACAVDPRQDDAKKNPAEIDDAAGE